MKNLDPKSALIGALILSTTLLLSSAAQDEKPNPDPLKTNYTQYWVLTWNVGDEGNFIELVEDSMARGWQLVGGIHVIPGVGSRQWSYYQALAK